MKNNFVIESLNLPADNARWYNIQTLPLYHLDLRGLTVLYYEHEIAIEEALPERTLI